MFFFVIERNRFLISAKTNKFCFSEKDDRETNHTASSIYYSAVMNQRRRRMKKHRFPRDSSLRGFKKHLVGKSSRVVAWFCTALRATVVFPMDLNASQQHNNTTRISKYLQIWLKLLALRNMNEEKGVFFF